MSSSAADLALYKRYVPLASGFGYTYGEPGTGERGQDVSAPAGSAVELPFAGIYRPDLSTQYQQVFQGANGLWESFTHVLALTSLQANKMYAAGSTIGTVYGGTGSYSSGGITYTSTGPHVEIGFLQSSAAPNPVSFFGNQTLDPTVLLRNGTPSGPPPPPPGWGDPGSGVNPEPGGTPGTYTPSDSTAPQITIGTPLGNVNVPSPVPFIQHLAVSIGFVLVIVVLGVLLIMSLMNREGVKAVPV